MSRPHFPSPIAEAQFEKGTHAPLSATHGIAAPVFRHRRLAVPAKLAFRLAPAMRSSVVAARLARGTPAVRASFSIIPAWAAINQARSNGRPSSSPALRSLRAQDKQWIG
ncbi:MAG: hypothetical protein M3178_05550 [Pseudomonadota bacterium]|nr:hypothetical protein [Pseudomonadota bacterium]